ncbi:hypothetical protein [Tateyamaria sp. ANG-S1]|uniref:hypothetical protein n=1 Tax=Tateyamaria sp. ANG-S1 TaxID=1577905 RepID=UPI00057D22B2|nr:hypothetical protein [Tateyamaria sp. ANG-S1]KIC51171.1 hypothetical protein RA29_04745 [Tateyamaria sp. ANG-S1]
MIRFLNTFISDEQGAVTVDWVVLCAAVIGLSIAVIFGINSGVLSLGGSIDTYLEGQFFSE